MKLTMKRNIVPHKNKAVIAVIIAVAGLALQQAHATRTPLPSSLASQPFVSDFNFGNEDISAYAPSYATLSINLIDATHATVSFASNTVAGHTYLFGGNNHSLGLNVNASTFSAGAVTGTRLGGSPGALSAHVGTFNGSFNGFGNFNLTIDDSDGFKDAFDGLTFSLTNTSGLWGSASDVLSLNAKGFDAAGHVFVADFVGGKYKNLEVTGFAAEGPGHGVPDGGATVILLGGALSVLGVVRRFIS